MKRLLYNAIRTPDGTVLESKYRHDYVSHTDANGVNFTKDMERLPKTIWKPVMDLNTDHIQAIVDGGYADKNPFYLEVFNEELKHRINIK